MSNMIFSQQDLHRIQRQDWGRLFGRLIRTGREKRGRSVEEVASLAGMEISEWLAIEAGHVPETAAQLHSMAAALGCTDTQMATLVCLCRDAWGV